MNTPHIVTATFNAFLLRNPTTAELNQYTLELDTELTTATLMAMEGAVLMPFQQQVLPFANLYRAAFGEYLPQSQMLVWGELLSKGLTLYQAAEHFIDSDAFQARITAAGNTPSLLQTIYSTATGNSLSSAEAAYYADLLDQGVITAADALLAVAERVDAQDTGLALLHTALSGDTGTYTPVSGAAAGDLLLSVNEVYNRYLISVGSNPASGLYEENGQLYVGNQLTQPLTINLDTDLITDENSNPVPPNPGQISAVSQINASNSSQSLTLIGSVINETFYTSPQGDTVRPKAGSDLIVLSETLASDTLIFEATATTTGSNIIHNFQVGSGGDLLDFSRFINKAIDTEPVVKALDISVVPGSGTLLDWDNTDILVLLITGNASSLAAEDVAAYFDGYIPPVPADPNLPVEPLPTPYLAQPDSSSKSVLITAGVIGDARIWYLSNAYEPERIDATEIQPVGTLINVNNLTLTSFPAENLL